MIRRLLVGSVAFLAATTVAASACSTPGGTKPADTAPPSSAAPDKAYREVEFTTRDGERRKGRLFGNGTTAVVLSHMGSPGASQDDWTTFAEELARRGYQALTYERRTTFGEVWQDVLGAADHMRGAGADRVIAAGASIGAMASLYAASQPDNGLHGVVWLAGVIRNRHYDFQQADVAAIACPTIYISGDKDAYLAADDARKLHTWTKNTSQLLILPSTRHGTEILTQGDPSSAPLTKAMSDFIGRVSNGRGPAC
ncbi:hypothetical protein K1W54_01835 [Micromonospora sp. CPCC 205371]|nr:hypothetical protein [Micromonospora sp. CPCC 205371]